MSQLITDETPWYARRNASGFYTWEGEQYRSVTTYLGYVAKQHLLLWYGKKAAQDCSLQVDLFERGDIDLEACFERIRDFGMRMRAGEVYRDFKAAVGSLVHHLLYHRALGSQMLQSPNDEDLHAWLCAEAKRMRVLDSVNQDGEVTEASEGDYRSIAAHASLYCRSAIQWFDIWRPAMESIGLEAYVLSRSYGFAGTMDTDWWHDFRLAERREFQNTITGRSYRLLRERLGKDTGRSVGDFKTSNGMSETFRYQVEAYANADCICLCPTDTQPAQEHPMASVDFTCVLHIKPWPESTELHVWPRDEQVFNGFLGLMDFVDIFTDTTFSRPMRAQRIARPKTPPVRTTPRQSPFRV